MGEREKPSWANEETVKVYEFFRGASPDHIQQPVKDIASRTRGRRSAVALAATKKLRLLEAIFQVCDPLGVDPKRVNWGGVAYLLMEDWGPKESAENWVLTPSEMIKALSIRAEGQEDEDRERVARRWIDKMETPLLQTAVRQLVIMGDPAAGPLIWASCGASTYGGNFGQEERRAAVEALHMIGPFAIERFLNSLRERDHDDQFGYHYGIDALEFLGRNRLVQLGRVVPLMAHYLLYGGEARVYTAYTLGRLGSPLAVPILLDYLRSYAPDRWDDAGDDDDFWEVAADDSRKRESCLSLLRALGQLRDARAVESLALFLDHPDEDVLGSAASALHRIGGPAREVIHTAGARALADLGSRDPALARRALAVLGGLGGPDCARAVAVRTGDPDTLIRERAVGALCRLPGSEHDDAVTEILLSALSDPDGRVRRTAAQGLKVQEGRLDARIGSVRARLQMPVEEARRMVLKPVVDALEDDVPQVRTYAMTMVMRQGVGFAADILREALTRIEALPSHVRADRDVDRARIRSWLADHGIPLNDGEAGEDA